jgi:hypothetical protein
MTDGLNETQVTILTWLVYALIVFLTGVTAYQQVQLIGIQKEKVSIERYKSGTSRIENTMENMNGKLDRLIEKGWGAKG